VFGHHKFPKGNYFTTVRNSGKKILETDLDPVHHQNTITLY